MGALGVVVISPSSNFLARMTEGSEPVKVQTFVSELAVETLHKGVLHWLAGLDEPQPHTGSL